MAYIFLAEKHLQQQRARQNKNDKKLQNHILKSLIIKLADTFYVVKYMLYVSLHCVQGKQWNILSCLM